MTSEIRLEELDTRDPIYEKQWRNRNWEAIGGNLSLLGEGWIDYNDSATSSSPVNLTQDTWTNIPNDGAGPFSNNFTLPGITRLLDTSNGNILVDELVLGDIILIRNDFTVTPTTNNSSLNFRYTLGADAGSYTLEKRLGRLDEGAGIGYRFSLGVDLIYMGDNNTKDNPIGLELNLSTVGTLVNAGSVITVVRHT